MKVLYLLSLVAPLCQAWPALRTPTGYPYGANAGKKAIYFLRVDPSGSSVVGLELDASGLISDSSSSTSTGGVGKQSQNYTDNLKPVAIDPLQSSQSITTGDDYLFTVNSGSDTAVMFKINPANPLKLDMVGKPMPTLGEFPNSIAYSSKYNKACVLNGGAVNGVTCYNVSPSDGLVPDGVGLRSFNFSATTPPQLGGPKGSGSEIIFSIDSSKVITTFKGTNNPVTLGHISIFDVNGSGDVAAHYTDNQVKPLSGGVFGLALSSDASHFYVTDASFGGVLVSLDYKTDVVSRVSVVNDTSFVASCWAAWSSETDLYYEINAGSPNLVRKSTLSIIIDADNFVLGRLELLTSGLDDYSVLYARANTLTGLIDKSGKLTKTVNFDKTLGGGTDTIMIGSKLYFLTAINDLAVFDTTSNKLVQHHGYSSSSNRPYWTGMAAWPPSKMLTGAL